jgi:methylated-DNA-[protein]-cysteine S-methyltransferase
MMETFSDACYRLVATVPEGKVTTYQEIAHALGTKAYRAVGNAMNKNPHAPKIPCHRVVRSDGSIGGFAREAEKKARMLEKEGVDIKDGKVDLGRFLHVL